MPMIDPMKEDGAESPWLSCTDGIDVVEQKNALIESLRNQIQGMRREQFRPQQVRDEEFALLTTEKESLEEKVKSLESKNEQLINVATHLSGLVKRSAAKVTTNEDFNDLVKKRIKQCTDILFVKNKEYSSTTDRLHNFKVAGQMLGQHPISALKGMMVKHEVSIFDIMSDVISGEQPPSYILMDEKFGDIHNYYFLLEALLEEYRDDRT